MHIFTKINIVYGIHEIKLEGCYSERGSVPYRVPQGAKLGPSVFFRIYKQSSSQQQYVNT